MLYVALAELGVIVVMLVAFSGFVRSQSRAHARRTDLLLNQLLHAVDRPWQPAPADTRPVEPPDWDALLSSGDYSRFTTSPEQEP